ncbi:DUF4214 domain-containing protein [Methylobacterium oxalidis]|uniref:DUF4214 domain-containing protein n=1 Tax=Methylobacterium oxalidis TaxID=944322 RepID=UPI0033152A6F
MAESTIILNVSADSYQGDPNFIVRVDGVQYGGIFTASALHTGPTSDQIQITGEFGAARQIMVEFLNDNFVEAGLDRNLYVDSIVFNGQTFEAPYVVIGSRSGTAADLTYTYGQSADLYWTGSKAFFNINGFSGSYIIDPDSFGSFTHDATTSGGAVYTLYEGLLGRAPDVIGLEFWADQFENGTSVRDLGQQLLFSAEGQARAGALGNAEFVTQLYQATLGRGPDAGGLQFWTDQLNQGAQRIDVALGFVFSSEHVASLQNVFSGGLFVPDKEAADVARLYYTMLGRAPDAGGIQFWSEQLELGGSLSGLAQGFLSSGENATKYGGMSNRDYVDALYMNALGRHAEAGGHDFWTARLDSGTSRADLAVQLSDSAEAMNFHVGQIEQGWQLI